ncbi:hypothetical protein [Bradyrhizobium genosp. SA-3]|uniref:hypothetical protein n=1 Tax=Bradyrhizobium genosp. SA-3 TaxID=508868 RepID=UPI001028ABC6|nr:hypothetical protein [Bradyrhizobium genosp. SA-3]
MNTKELPKVESVSLPDGWKEAGEESAISITLEVWGRKCSMIVGGDEAFRFVEQVRDLHKRRQARLHYLETTDDDVQGHVTIKHCSNGYVLTLEYTLCEIVGDDVLRQEARRDLRLSVEQMNDFLDQITSTASEIDLEAIAA